MDPGHCLLFLKVVDIEDGVSNVNVHTKLKDLPIGSLILYNHKVYIVTDLNYTDIDDNLFISCCDINSGRLDDFNSDIMVMVMVI